MGCRLIINHSEDIDEEKYPKGYIYGKKPDLAQKKDDPVADGAKTIVDSATTIANKEKETTTTDKNKNPETSETQSVDKEKETSTNGKRKKPETSETPSIAENGAHKIQKVK